MIFKEFELKDNHPLIPSLNKMLEWLRLSDVPNQMNGDPNGCDLSDECLQGRIDKKFPNKCWMSRFDHHEDYDFSDVQKYSELAYREQTGITDYDLQIVAKTWYPSDGGYLGWHIDTEGGRIYSTWADGESFFRYRDPETKEIITSYDKPNQWTFRVFTFTEDPIWHCVYAEDTRISVGFKFSP